MPVTDFPTEGDDKQVSLRNSQYPQFDYEWAVRLRDEHPDVWNEGGMERGTSAFTNWGKARDGDLTEAVLAWIREREAWAARHFDNNRLPGVIAQIKWGVIGTLGEAGMKELVNEAKRKGLDSSSTMKSMDTRTLRLKASVSAKADGIYRFIGSTAAVDRVGEVVEQNWDLENYKRNPVILYGHDQSGLPIGKAVNVAVENGALTFDVKFVPAEIYPFAGTVEAMYRDGFLNAVSVGFIPTDVDGNTIKKAELLELSAVPVPANHEALMQRGARKMLPVFRAFDHGDLVKNIANRAAFDEFFGAIVAKAMEEEAPVEESKKSLNELLILVQEAMSDLQEGDTESVASDLNAIAAMIQILIDEETPDAPNAGEGTPMGDPGAGSEGASMDQKSVDAVIKQLGAPMAHSIESVLADPDAVSAILKAIGTPK